MNKTLITQMVLNVMENLLTSQDIKGKDKYGRTLDTVPLEEYDWNLMAIEEMADGLKYLMMENVRLRDEVERLQKLNDFKTSNLQKMFDLKEKYRVELEKKQRIWMNDGDL